MNKVTGHQAANKKHALRNRFSIIAGQREVGKTTAIIQYIYSFIQEDIVSRKALYVPVDHFMVVGHSLYDIAEEFVNYGGQLLCFDEIHKYPNWSRELKMLLATIARSAPFTPDMKRLKQIIEVGDERTLKTYLSYLEDGKIHPGIRRRYNDNKLREISSQRKIFKTSIQMKFIYVS